MPAAASENPYEALYPDTRNAGVGGFPSFVVRILRSPVDELCVVPFRLEADTQQIVLVDADGQPGSGWLQACVRVPQGSPDKVLWSPLPQDDGWDVAGEPEHLGFKPERCDGVLLLFIALRAKGGLWGYTAAFAAAAWARVTGLFGEGGAVSAKQPSKEQIRTAVEALRQDDRNRAVVRWR